MHIPRTQQISTCANRTPYYRILVACVQNPHGIAVRRADLIAARSNANIWFVCNNGHRSAQEFFSASFTFLPPFGNTLLLKSNTGSGHGSPTASMTVSRARYQPQITPSIPKPPPILSRYATCSRSAAVVADGTAKSAAAMKANRKTRPMKTSVNNAFTRSVPTKRTKLTRHLFTG